MEQVIWKWPLAVVDMQTIQMPVDAMPLFVEEQNGLPTLWTKSSPSGPLKDRTFHVYGTGHQVTNEDFYLGSCKCGQFVWHVFEVKA